MRVRSVARLAPCCAGKGSTARTWTSGVSSAVRGALQALAPQKRGPKPDPQAAEIARLRRENERLQQRLQRAETIIEVQKKLSALLGLPTSESDEQP